MQGTIKINPSVFTDKRDAFAVAVNEALRLWMEDNNFIPGSGVTEEQRAFFKDTAYANDEGAMAKTVLARIATRDKSFKGSPEQVAETDRLLREILKPMDLQDPDFLLISRMLDALPYDNPKEESVVGVEPRDDKRDEKQNGDNGNAAPVPESGQE